MARAYSSANVRAKKFKLVDFEGKWLASFGRPALQGTWLIYGKSGSGKTSFTLALAKYLTQYARVLYNSLEQGLSPTLQSAWLREGLDLVPRRIRLLDREGYEELVERLKKRQSPEIVIIDSINYFKGLRLSDYDKLRTKFRKKLFIVIAHEKGGEPKGALAQDIKYDADVKIRVEGYRARFTSRYATGDEGGQDFIIWDEGAGRYWGTDSTDPDEADVARKRLQADARTKYKITPQNEDDNESQRH